MKWCEVNGKFIFGVLNVYKFIVVVGVFYFLEDEELVVDYFCKFSLGKFEF